MENILYKSDKWGCIKQSRAVWAKEKRNRRLSQRNKSHIVLSCACQCTLNNIARSWSSKLQTEEKSNMAAVCVACFSINKRSRLQCDFVFMSTLSCSSRGHTYTQTLFWHSPLTDYWMPPAPNLCISKNNLIKLFDILWNMHWNMHSLSFWQCWDWYHSHFCLVHMKLQLASGELKDWKQGEKASLALFKLYKSIYQHL